MRRQFRVQARTQAPETVGVVLLNRKLVGQLPVDRLNKLAKARDQIRIVAD